MTEATTKARFRVRYYDAKLSHKGIMGFAKAELRAVGQRLLEQSSEEVAAQ